MESRRDETRRHLWTLTIAVAALTALVMGTAAAADHQSDQQGSSARPEPARQSPPGRVCTVALPTIHATIEVRIPNAGDFCELVSQALAGDVFHVPVLVTPGLAWHYADADGVLSCLLGYRNTRHRLTIRNSVPACRWLSRPTTGWRPIYAPGLFNTVSTEGPPAKVQE
jgi:hypothetical protein